MTGAFEGFTVVELADRRNQLAGKLLSDGGARVIQVEPPAGSPGRWCGPFVDDKPDPDRCLDYWYHNTGKQSVCIAMDHPAGQDLLLRLLDKADVFLESTSPGTLAPLGLGYETVAKRNPALIYAALTDFGQDGPWVHYQMNDFAHLALGGQMASSGYSDPTISPMGGHGHQAWNMGSVLVTHGITMALYERLSSGEGQFIDTAIHDCCAICTERALPYWLYYNESFLRQTATHAGPIRQPSLQARAADGRVVAAAIVHFSNNMWIRLLAWMNELGVAGDLNDEQYRDEFYRAQQFREAPEIREAIHRLIGSVPAIEAATRGQEMGMAWVVVNAPEENYDLPHYQQREFWQPIEHEEIGRAIPYPRGFYKSAELTVEPRSRAPHLGEHTRCVLAADLGYTDAQIDALSASGVIR